MDNRGVQTFLKKLWLQPTGLQRRLLGSEVVLLRSHQASLEQSSTAHIKQG